MKEKLLIEIDADLKKRLKILSVIIKKPICKIIDELLRNDPRLKVKELNCRKIG